MGLCKRLAGESVEKFPVEAMASGLDWVHQ